VWDGIGGILKGYLRRVNVRFLALNPNVDDPERNPVLCDDGRIRTAEHVYQQLERSFGSAAWRLKAEEKTRAISRFSFKFMTTRDIARPTSQVIYERIKGISRSYQYLMIKEGDVLVRRHSCWCLPCLQVAMLGHSALTSNYVIKGCARGVADAGLYEYANKNCRAKKGAGAGDPDARAREHGHGLAAELDARGGRGGCHRPVPSLRGLRRGQGRRRDLVGEGRRRC